MRTIRILVVEDSVTIRKRLVEVFAAEPGMEVAAEAGDGKACIELCRELRLDLVTLDMVLPVMSGLAATEYIMAYCPTPILIVSSSSNRGEMFKTFEAPGRVLMAPPEHHLEVHAGCWRLNQGPERHSCRPSVDVLFESLARTMGQQTIACLLTGMGTDGATGLLAIRQAAGRTLVQDQAASVVFGMPQKAIRLGAADQVLGLDEFAPALAALAQGNGWRPT